MSAGRIPTTANSPLTTKGDLFTYSTASAKLAVGANNTVLIADSTQTTGLKYANGSVGTLTTTGDILYASAANTPARLGIGSASQVLTVASGIPSWATPSNFGAWTNYTPTITAEVGTATSITNIAGRYQLNGPTVLVQATWRVTTVGTANGHTQITLPYTSNTSAKIAVGTCYESESAGTMGFVKNVPNQAFARTNTYSGGYWWTINFTMNIQIEYEVA